jgi:3-oxoadipate CoA-transferase beta subunit
VLFRSKSGESKLVETCSYPLTGVGCVSRIYSDLAVIDLAGGKASVIDIVDGLSFDELQALTAVPLHNAL